MILQATKHYIFISLLTFTGLCVQISKIVCPRTNADAEESRLSIAAIFRRYWSDYRQNNQVTPSQSKVVYDILNCRTGSFGYSISACDNCGHREVFLNSCRNSHCPSCQGNKRMEWVESQD
ncbi:MAG: transposase zinc-binding domain-containing protein [Desulfamplus sp.]|nr:transposase zinc-binding domain-containing protein [Desulfamplus sp.]